MTLSRSNLSNQVFTRNFWLRWGVPLIAIMLIALGLRSIQGPQHFIWDYDQARDSFAATRVFRERDIILVGQQAEIYGMFHGPLSYYYKSPFYAAGDGQPTFVIPAMIFWNMLTLIPLGLLAHQLFKNHWLTLLTLLLFAVSYDQIGYARWISNVSMSIPLLALTYLSLYMVSVKQHRRHWSLLLGASLGLAIQGQLFLLYFIAWVVIFFLWYKQPLSIWIRFFLGLGIMLLPQMLFELKYGFQSSKILYEWIILAKGRHFLTGGEAVMGYLNHMGLTAYHAVTGISSGLGIYALFTSMCMFVLQFLKKKVTPIPYSSLSFILFLTLSHAVVFVFHYVDAVFQDLGIGIALILLAVATLQILWHYQRKSIALLAGVFLVAAQLSLLSKYTTQQTPYGLYKFAQTGVLLSQKLEIVDKIYELSEGNSFTYGVFGNPYGVRTLWASVFDIYRDKHPQASLPQWYGYHANGYAGDDYFTPTDHPGAQHILLIEPNEAMHSPFIRDEYFASINETTTLLQEEELHGYRIQLRTPKSDLNK